MTKLEYVDENGNSVPEGDERAAYQVNPSDPLSGEFVERLKAKAPEKSTLKEADKEADAKPSTPKESTPDSKKPKK